MFSRTYSPPDAQFHSDLFQNGPPEICLRVDLRVWLSFGLMQSITGPARRRFDVGAERCRNGLKANRETRKADRGSKLPSRSSPGPSYNCAIQLLLAYGYGPPRPEARLDSLYRLYQRGGGESIMRRSIRTNPEAGKYWNTELRGWRMLSRVQQSERLNIAP
jgi:hypothetical protein